MKLCAAILSGGLGTRLRPVVNDRPKVMAMVAGRPFLTHLLDQLVKSGIQKAVLCTGYMAETIRKELGVRYRELELVYSVEDEPLGTGGALRLACETLSEEILLVLNGDSYCECHLADFIFRQAASNTSAGMVLAKVDDVARFGAVQTNSESLVESFIEKGLQTGSGWINAGVYLLPTSRIREIFPGRSVSLEREVIPHIIADGLYGYQCSGSFIDIGIPEEYQRAQLLFTEELKGKP
jgi:NDP-sugar pyrophosphorylase family protein